MKLGIVGLPNVGKSTLFNAITNAGVPADNYAFCTIDPNVGVVSVPDERLDWLSDFYKPKKQTPAVIEFVDIAGLVKGASKGEGLGNQFLSHIRNTDAIAEVVRCFEDENVTHVEGSVDPVRDIQIIDTELCLADIDTINNRMKKVEKLLKAHDKKAAAEQALLERVAKGLEDIVPARRMEFTEEEEAALYDLHLLTRKPIIYVCNVAEEEAADASGNPHVKAVQEFAAQEHAEVVVISAKVEAEIAL